MSADCEVIQILPERHQKHEKETGNLTMKDVDMLNFCMKGRYCHTNFYIFIFNTILIFLFVSKMRKVVITCLMREA